MAFRSIFVRQSLSCISRLEPIQHFVGQAPLVLARESKKRSGNVRYSALLCSACGFRSARKSVYNLTQQQSQEPELYKRGERKRAPAIRSTISLPHTLLRGAYPRCPLRAMRVRRSRFLNLRLRLGPGVSRSNPVCCRRVSHRPSRARLPRGGHPSRQTIPAI